MDLVNFKDYLNKWVYIRYGKNNSISRGKLVGIRIDKICFNPTTILSKNGEYTACCKSNLVRWFTKNKIKSINYEV